MLKQTIGICITTHNNQDIITTTLNSALNQMTTARVKIYVVDDGSTDKTGQILTQYQENYSNIKIKLAPHRERGITRTEAIQFALDDKCDYILFIDSDMKLESNLIHECLKQFRHNKLSALVIPEAPYSSHENFMTKVKVFERMLVNNGDGELERNSTEAARFWKSSEYLRSGGLNPTQISFEETQPTIRIRERGGIVKRAVNTHIHHNEGLVSLKNIIQKKRYYFSVMNNTSQSEDKGFIKMLQRWYFFRPYMYSFKNLCLYIKNPLKFLGLIFMYIILTLTAVQANICKS